MLLLALAAASVACSNPRCVISGKVENLNDGYIYLADQSNMEIIDSALVSNGKFKFVNCSEEPTLALILNGKSPIATVFTDNGKITVTGDAASDEGLVVSGTPSNDGIAAMRAEFGDLLDRMNKADESEKEKFVDEYYALIDRHIEANRDNLFGVYSLLDSKSARLSGKELLEEINKFPEELRNNKVVKEAIEKAERKMKVEPQAEGSDFVPKYINIVQKNIHGEEISLRDVVQNPKNKYVLVDFWASWCQPCMHEVPVLVKAYKKYHKLGFEIYGVSFDRDIAKWKDAMKKNGMKWINVSSLNSFDNQAAEDYVIEAIPANVLIDCSNGTIIARDLRGEDVEKRLAEIFGK